jgi:hypothetical protein
MNAYLFLFLCHHNKYSYGFLHATKLFTLGLKFMMQQSKHIFLFSFLMQCLMQKSKHAKWRMIMQMLKSNYIESETNAMLKKINMDDYQFYLSARVQ